MQTDREIKKLKSKILEHKNQITDLKSILSTTNKQIQQHHNEIGELEKQIKIIAQDQSLSVSEHAVIRYLERIEGVDIAAIEQKILTDKLRAMVKVLGGKGEYPVDGFKVVLKDYKIVTVKK